MAGVKARQRLFSRQIVAVLREQCVTVVVANRARVINGLLKFRSSPNGGTLVSCIFPKGAEHGI